MALKLIMNVLYTICIFICIVFVFYSVKNHHWSYVMGGTFIGAMVVIFKLRLIKDVKESQKKAVTSTKKT